MVVLVTSYRAFAVFASMVHYQNTGVSLHPNVDGEIKKNINFFCRTLDSGSETGYLFSKTSSHRN